MELEKFREVHTQQENKAKEQQIENDSLRALLMSVEHELNEREKHITSIQHDVSNKNQQISQQFQINEAMTKTIEQLRAELSTKESQLGCLQGSNRELKEDIECAGKDLVTLATCYLSSLQDWDRGVHCHKGETCGILIKLGDWMCGNVQANVQYWTNTPRQKV